MDDEKPRDEEPRLESADELAARPEVREILDAKPDLLVDAANAMSGMGDRMATFLQRLDSEVLSTLDASDPDSVTRAADNATQLGRDLAAEDERLRLIDTAVSEAVGPSTPVAEAMNRFCETWQAKMRSLGEEVQRSAQQLRDSQEGS